MYLMIFQHNKAFINVTAIRCIYFTQNAFNTHSVFVANAREQVQKALTNILVHILSSSSQSVQALLVSLMTAMTEVKPSHIHSCLDECLELVDSPTGRAEGANDFSTTGTVVVGLFDRIQSDVAAR